jgi:cystathionine gamma-lyase
MEEAKKAEKAKSEESKTSTTPTPSSYYTGFTSKAVHIGSKPDKTNAIITPICVSSNYVVPSPPFTVSLSSDQNSQSYIYSRVNNPTRFGFEQCLATLEKCKYGIAVGSGSAAGVLILELLCPGDHVISCEGMYGGLYTYFCGIATESRGLLFDFVDFNDEERYRAAFKENTKLVWVETPTNPLLNVFDVGKVVRIAKEHGCLVVFDNTFMTPFLMNPVDFGVDVVFHSCTKYIGGHSDVILGAITLNDDQLHQKLRKHSIRKKAVSF